MRQKTKFGAYTRSSGKTCQAQSLASGRCRNHGGLSPKTPEGRKAIAEATRQRLTSGQQEKALAGRMTWLDWRSYAHTKHLTNLLAK